MELDTKNIKIDGSSVKVGIIVPYFNESIGLELLKNCKDELLEQNVAEENISITRVAGALETPFAASKIIQTEQPDAVITLGAIIKGETSHYDLVTEKTYDGLMAVQLNTGIPIIFGILTCENEKQAKERSSKKGLNKGKQAAQAALIQATL
ncbi:6,7-dimethyl-8-ribityllumazine synthase [Candidatus Peregrinibacteria bacterium]|jgi:6,7-dimethyl-8-ribityllumazine synthase|nr:6,7-dimethyl-8-ribityllumazine synthase [Candidatus Peregrinibacteria bacterium]MBT7736530.1 6,7-dimethyl-8-ribityllumazine synthase [Candidatus Peregrinibacteria bacterium]